MKKGFVIIKAALVLLFLSAGLVSAAGHARITGAELTEMMGDGKPVVIVDVRETWLYSRGHIPGAVNIPYEDDSQVRVLKELKPSDRIVFVCHGGPMGDELASILVNNGYKDVYNLKGGMRRWRGRLEK